MKFYLVLWALVIASSLPATTLPVKSNLTGRIIDADLNEPLEFATISVFDLEKTLITGASTDEMGRFNIRLPKGEYRIAFEFLGYTSMDTTINLKSNLNLGDIKLYSEAVTLDGATVTAERSRLTLKLDKQIFDVGADIISQGGQPTKFWIMFQW